MDAPLRWAATAEDQGFEEDEEGHEQRREGTGNNAMRRRSRWSSSAFKENTDGTGEARSREEWMERIQKDPPVNMLFGANEENAQEKILSSLAQDRTLSSPAQDGILSSPSRGDQEEPFPNSAPLPNGWEINQHRGLLIKPENAKPLMGSTKSGSFQSLSLTEQSEEESPENRAFSFKSRPLLMAGLLSSTSPTGESSIFAKDDEEQDKESAPARDAAAQAASRKPGQGLGEPAAGDDSSFSAEEGDDGDRDEDALVEARYAEFLDALGQSQASDIARRIKLFIVSCQLEHSDRSSSLAGGPSNTYRSDSIAPRLPWDSSPIKHGVGSLDEDEYIAHVQRRVREFFREAVPALLDHPYMSRLGQHCLIDGIERNVLVQLHSTVYAHCAESIRRSAALDARIAELAKLVTADHLEVPTACRNEVVLSLVGHELGRINGVSCPQDKLACVVRSCSILFNTLSISSRATATRYRRRLGSRGNDSVVGLGADDFVPALFFAVLQAGVPRLLLNVDFIYKFRDPASLVSRSGYCLASLRSALEFFACCTPQSFKGMPHHAPFPEHAQLRDTDGQHAVRNRETAPP